MKKWAGRSLSCVIAAVLCFTLLPDISLAAEGTETVEIEVEYRQTEARSMLDEINAFRTGEDAWCWDEDNDEKVYAENLGELTYDYELERIAMQRAAELAISFSHTRPDGTAWSTLFDGYSSMGENLAAGYASAEDTFIQWAEEDEDYDGQGHRRNMLSENFTSVGIACVYYNGYYFWVQEFGSPASGAASTEANDSITTVDVDVLLSDITDPELVLETDSLTVTVGETVSLPEVSADFRMTNTRPDNVTCSVTPVNYTWEIDDDAYAVITGDAVEGLEAGETTLTVSALGKEVSITLKVEDPHEHTYGDPVFEWSDDHTSCTAVFTCEDGDDTQKVICTVTSETTGATCTAAGGTSYTAAAEFGDRIYTDQATVPGDPATGHSYGEPVFTWESDYQSATASVVCSRCGTELTAECQISSQVTAPSCTADGSITYTAAAVINGTEYTDTRTVSGDPATGHSWFYTDNEDGTHTAECAGCGNTFTEAHAYADGICSLCGSEEHVHSYTEPAFAWSDDYTGVTAVFTCSCGDIQEVLCDISAETAAPTCTEDGYILYTATVTFGGRTYTDTATAAGVSATGHTYLYVDNGDDTHTGTCSICGDTVTGSHTYVDGICVSCGSAEAASHIHVYGTPEFTWSNDYASCMAVFTCEDGDDSREVECVVTSVDNGDGTVTYTATAEFNGISCEDTLTAGQAEEVPGDPSGSGDDADDIIGSGTCGDDLTWVLTGDGTLTISGTGEMEDYSYFSPSYDAPWYSLRGDIVAVVIENGVTSIGDAAFASCTSLTSVTIPDSVTSIGFTAFINCTSLTDITIPDGVTDIGDGAFMNCSSLTGITISDSVTNIGVAAFADCSSLTSITIPDGVTTIGNYAFDGCSSLTSITIPDSVTTIGTRAFDSCWALSDIYYAGSEDEWDEIKGGFKSTLMGSVTIHYNSTGPDSDTEEQPSAGGDQMTDTPSPGDDVDIEDPAGDGTAGEGAGDDGSSAVTPDDGADTEEPGDDGTSSGDDATDEGTGDDGTSSEIPDDGADTEEPGDEGTSSGDDATDEDTGDDGTSSEIPDDGADTEDPGDDGTFSGDDATDEGTGDDGSSAVTPDDDADTEEPSDDGTSSGDDVTGEGFGEDDNTADVPDDDTSADGTADADGSTSTDDGASGSSPDTTDDGSSQASGNDGSDADSQSSGTGSSTSSGTSAQTGDNSNIAVWFMLLAAGGAAAVSGIRRKKKPY